MDVVSEGALTAAIGFVGGILLGLAARRGRFCTLGAIEDALYGRDYGRMRMWALALAVAIAGAFTLEALGALDLRGSIYAGQGWSPAAAVLGGLVFGYGMALAGNCGFGALARCGGGDLRAFVIVLVMGVSAYMAVAGPTGALRARLFPAAPPVSDLAEYGFAHGVGAALGVAPAAPALLVAAALAAWALSSPGFRRTRERALWSMAVGVAVALGWWGTAWVARTGFDGVRVESHSFTAPIGDSLLYVMTSTGGGLGFGVGSVAGVLVGAFIGSLSRGHFRWEACDDPRELGRQILGAFLMGTGGVLALGCSVGQGLTAFSTLAWSGPVVLLSIFVGAALGLRQLIRGYSPA
jgi:uncharacterized membrane protein YedE/YeeE